MSRSEAPDSVDSEWDRSTGEAFIQENLARINYLSRTIARNIVDPEDLAADAILSLLGAWDEGHGPKADPLPYLAASMRNRIKDHLKSPRSRTEAFSDWDDLPLDHAEGDLVDVAEERAVVTQALNTLPSDQRQVLVEMTVNGVKPRELESKLGRPAPAISSLHRRARLSLRRAVLTAVLSDHAPEACKEAIEQIPAVFPDTLDSSFGDEAPHFLDCPRCKIAWHRFSTLLSAFGLLPLIVLSHRALSFSALADTPPQAPVASDGTRSQLSPSRPTYERELSPPLPAALELPAFGPSLASPRNTAQVGRPVLRSEEEARSADFAHDSSAEKGAIHPLRSKFRVGTGLTLITVGALSLTATTSQWHSIADFEVEAFPASLSVDATISPQRAVYTLAVDANEDYAPGAQIDLDLDRTPFTVLAPDGWRCEIKQHLVLCVSQEKGPINATFEVTLDTSIVPVRTTIALNGTLESGRYAEGGAQLELYGRSSEDTPFSPT